MTLLSLTDSESPVKGDDSLRTFPEPPKSDIRALILKGNTHEIISLLQTGIKYGMFTMDQTLQQLKEEGLISDKKDTRNIIDEIIA